MKSDAVLLADVLHAVREARIGAQGLFDCFVADAEGAARHNRRCCVRRVVRALERPPVLLSKAGAQSREALDSIDANDGFAGLDPCLHRGTDPQRPLHLEQPPFRRRVSLEALVPIEVIGRDVEQHCDVAIEALRQVDLVARQLQHVDAAFGQRVLGEDREADVAAHRRRHARGLEDVVDQRGGGRLAVGAGDPDDLVRRKLGAGAGEQLDVADDLDAGLAGALRDRVAVERQARGDDEAVELREVGLVRVRRFPFPGEGRGPGQREPLLRIGLGPGLRRGAGCHPTRSPSPRWRAAL